MTERRTRPGRRPGVRGDTRMALIEGAFRLLDGNKSFDGLSQRELTREVGIVPTAFYRHFETMEALGPALVDEAFRGLRKIIHDVRTDVRSSNRPVSTVVRSLLQHIRNDRSRFRFIASERFGGSGPVRDAIRREMRLIQGELAIELA
ncbi:MAG: TetR family transcriptional regulator, partial [Oceanococcaceae bacterium]